ncbi:MAG: metalloregulator ArsR/SmtB family transcription factor [Rhodospirillales bacterium]|nr:metalloregulator ArsR/SmtB family transcription factor [Rhodospirillales bacterium]
MRDAADRASELLKSLGNRHRLLILCQIAGAERSVGELAVFLGLRDSTVSQHLSLLRKDGLVRTRRDGQTIWYAIASAPAARVLETLFDVFCRPGSLCTPVAPAAEPPVTRPAEPPVTRPAEPPVTRPAEPPVTRPAEPPVTRPSAPRPKQARPKQARAKQPGAQQPAAQQQGTKRAARRQPGPKPARAPARPSRS